MRIALWQGPSPAGNVAAGVAALVPMIRAAGAAGASVLVAPEVWLPGYNHGQVAQKALAATAPALDELAAACRAAGCGLVLGYAEAADGAVWNSAVFLDAAGARVANYRKIQLYGPRERALYRAGDAYVTFDLDGRRAALLICYDIEFAPHVAALAAQGVDLILVPTANMAPFTHVVRATVPAMAANYGLSIAYANYCGSEGDLTYVGGSLIAGPHGEVLAQAGDHPALLVADLPPRDPARLSTQLQDFRKVQDAP
ncbi:nitrilase [Aliigemmobacter aestuarii]|uniref:Nitrilase n=1 Tax=Aliigemmobacter aestuarii TaxID=1445661 RepID=A0A4S3MKR7_9RHOB|nr:nitrilase-related carbon-nitrogen hydrolase [Gemmobacter aestuarii]THD82363.1 nitrilase [Gemmobacter aestuarii]